MHDLFDDEDLEFVIEARFEYTEAPVETADRVVLIEEAKIRYQLDLFMQKLRPVLAASSA